MDQESPAGSRQQAAEVSPSTASQKPLQKQSNNEQLPDGIELVQATINLTEKNDKEIRGGKEISGVNLGDGDLEHATSGTSVLVSTSSRVYLSISTPRGRLNVWRVADSRFIFSTQEPIPRYITAYLGNGSWFPVWRTGSNPADVTEANMATDQRVWQVLEKFSEYFCRLEKAKHLYLNAGEENLHILDVGDQENTRNVTPLQVTLF